MSVRPISVKVNSNNSNSNTDLPKEQSRNIPSAANVSQLNNAQQVPFGNAVVMFMDGIERGGFIASFMTQDFCGMVAPRIYEGLNRNREETGELNWNFAKREAIREGLSGPSMFVIPATMLYFIKKFSGTANNIPVDYIKAFGKDFSEYAKGQSVNIADKAKTQEEFYEQIYRNVLRTSTENQMPEEEINATAKKFAQELAKVRDAKSKGFWKKLVDKPMPESREDLLGKISNEFISIRKKYTSPSESHWVAEFSLGSDKNAGKIAASFDKFSTKLLDYANDATENAKNFVESKKGGNVVEFIQKHASRRMGSRIITNVGMWATLVGFFAMIPKIYNMGLKTNPGMAGLDDKPTDDTFDSGNKQADSIKAEDKVSNGEQINFSGKEKIFSGIAENITNSKPLKKASDFFEFDGPSMTTNSTLALLFGFCLPTRLMNAQDHHDNKEIMTRDFLSFTAILFGANALSRGFSKLFAGISGLALNTTPDDHEKSFFHKLKNYFHPNGGIGVFKSNEITAKYSNVHEYKDGINGFFDFVQENGGNIKRMLAIDPEIKKHTEKIIGKELQHAKNGEIESAFKKAKGTKELDAIYEILKNPNNKLVKRAKMLNSTFGLASIVALVPAFMIWLAKHCEKMTKADVNKEKFTEIAKDYMHEDFSSADFDTIKALDEKVLNDIKANKIYGYKYDKANNIIRDLTGKEKQVSDVRVEIKKFVDKAVPKGQKRVIHKHPKHQESQNVDYTTFTATQSQLKQNFLTK